MYRATVPAGAQIEQSARQGFGQVDSAELTGGRFHIARRQLPAVLIQYFKKNNRVGALRQIKYIRRGVRENAEGGSVRQGLVTIHCGRGKIHVIVVVCREKKLGRKEKGETTKKSDYPPLLRNKEPKQNMIKEFNFKNEAKIS
ncbi:MAG: hypothetical protein U0U46_04445 [Saprospiraceae bacterium]